MTGTAPTPAGSAEAPVNERVASLVNEVIRAATAAGAEHLSDRLRSEGARWRATETSVVVAAEPNRGKSSLVNALLDEEILPSGATAATSAYVLIRHGDVAGAKVLRDGSAPTEVSLSEVASLATAPVAEGVEGVLVDLPNAMLATGLTLVDTPGVGGLSEAHGRITLAALSKADAMVFVLDPSEPLSASELEFLGKAGERLDRVVFVMSRVDRYPGWKQILTDDRQLIDARAPAFEGAPIVGTSARLASIALEDPDDPDTELLAESGVPALRQELLRSIVGRVAAIRLANLLRLTTTTVDDLERPLLAAAEAAQGDSEARAVAEREQVAYEEFRDAAERLQIEVTDRFNAIREQASNEFTRMMREVGLQFESVKAEAGAVDAMVERVYSELRASCAELSEQLDAEVSRIAFDIASVVGDLDVELPSLDLGSNVLESSDHAVEAAGADPLARLRIASAVASGGTGFTMFARYVSNDPLIAGMLGAGALLAVTVGVINVRMARRQRDEAGLRKQVQAALEGARTEVSPILRQQILSVQRELERAMKATVRQHGKEFQVRIADATQLARSDAATRDAARKDAERRIAALAPLRQRIGGLRIEIDRILAAP